MRCRTASAPITVILEDTGIQKRRCSCAAPAKLGWMTVAGQLGTMVLSRLEQAVLRGRAAQHRCRERAGDQTRARDQADHRGVLGQFAGILAAAIDADASLRSSCSPAAACCRKTTLAAMPCPVLNYHAGITPEISRHERRLLGAGDRRCRKFRRDGASGRCRRRYRRRAPPGPRQAGTGRQSHASMRCGWRRCRATSASGASKTRLSGRLAPDQTGYAVKAMVSSDDLVLSLDRIDQGRVVANRPALSCLRHSARRF